MTDEEDINELHYIKGGRRAWLSMLQQCLRELGYDDLEARKAAWIVEREETIATLRRVCEDYGDNDWGNGLNLSDVIEKHLHRHLP